jgi:hypothetical protein
MTPLRWEANTPVEQVCKVLAITEQEAREIFHDHPIPGYDRVDLVALEQHLHRLYGNYEAEGLTISGVLLRAGGEAFLRWVDWWAGIARERRQECWILKLNS